MKSSEIKKILLKVYEIDSKMDEWLDHHAKCLEEGKNDKAAVCEREYERLSATIHGMTLALDALGYRLTDTGDGYWKIITREEEK